MRRVYLRGRENVWKRVLIHVGALNLSLVMRKLCGKGTPRGWQGFSAEAVLALLRLWMTVLEQEAATVVLPGLEMRQYRAQVTIFLMPALD